MTRHIFELEFAFRRGIAARASSLMERDMRAMSGSALRTFGALVAMFALSAPVASHAEAPAIATTATTTATTATTATTVTTPTNVTSMDQWSARLLALDPARPTDYFNLAEEISDTLPAVTISENQSDALGDTQSDAQRELARHLFALAGALNTPTLGRGAMLAIAGLATSATGRERALAAAELVGGRGERKTAFRPESAQIEALARAFSFYRKGMGAKALSALRQSDADALLDVISDAIPGGAAALRAECKSMRANTRLYIDPEHERTLLLIELALRRGELRGLGLDIVLHGDRALIEIDCDDAASLWQIDPKLVWWRDGAWSATQ